MVTEIIKTYPKILTGKVVSLAMVKTVVVKVNRLIKHPKYRKRFVRSKKYLAHDETGRYQIGDEVKIQETRPYSRRKTFKVI